MERETSASRAVPANSVAQRGDAFNGERSDVTPEENDRGEQCAQMKKNDQREGVLANVEEPSSDRHMSTTRHWKKLGQPLQCTQCGCRQ